MKGITKLSAAILAGATAISAYASDPLRSVSIDSLVQDHKIIYVGNGQESAHPDSIRSLVERFYYDQYRSFQDPAAPYFLFMSRDANLAMGLGGVVRMRGYFDPGNSMPTPGFNTFDIPMGDTPLNRNHFGTTPAVRRFSSASSDATPRSTRINCTYKPNSTDTALATSSYPKPTRR